MAFEKQYKDMKIITRLMLLEVGIYEDEDFDFKISTMAITLLDDLYNKGYSQREINNAIRVLLLASRVV